MRIILNGILILLFTGCFPSNEMDLINLIPISGNWNLITTYGGSEEDIAHGIAATADGGYIVVGNSKSTDGTFSNKKRAGSDIFLMKFNALNEVEWTSTYGGSEDDRGHDVVQLRDGGFAVVGYSQSSDGDASRNEGQHDNWVFKVDAQGNLLWEKSFGFLGHDHAYNIISTLDGGLFFNGFLDVTASNGAGQDGKVQLTKKHGVGEFWCHKLDADGNLQWRRYFGGTSNDRSYDAIETTEGDFVLVGASESQDLDISDPRGSYDAWIVKLNAGGDLIWERSFGGSEYDGAQSILENRNGDYVVMGQTYSKDEDIKNAKGSSDIFLAFYSKEGVLKSTTNIGNEGFETASALFERADGTLVLLGHQAPLGMSSQESFLTNNLFLAHTLGNGSVINTYTMKGNGLDIPYGIREDKTGKIYVVGSTESSAGNFPNSRGGKDIFVTKWH